MIKSLSRRLAALLAALTATVAVTTVVGAQPAFADCTAGNGWGGDLLCGYHLDLAHLNGGLGNGGIDQIFVIGLDYAVWTRWRWDNYQEAQSSWVSLGGTVRSGGSSFSVTLRDASSNTPIAQVIGTDGNHWCDRRGSGGGWSGWYRC